jgi:hypothetical protein
MMFEATLTERGIRGHYFLEDISAENGMHRGHCWVNQDQSYLGALPIPSKLRIDAKYRRYRSGDDGWTLTAIRSVEVIL